MAELPRMPHEYENDPSVADSTPSAAALDYVPGAELTVVEVDDEVTFMDVDQADEDGVTSAWITVDEAGRVYPRDYA